RSPLRDRGLETVAREQPDDDEAGDAFDQAVGAEADQRDRAGADSCAERDGELDQVPAVAAPREQARAPLQALTVIERENRHSPARSQFNRALAHAVRVSPAALEG